MTITLNDEQLDVLAESWIDGVGEPEVPCPIPDEATLVGPSDTVATATCWTFSNCCTTFCGPVGSYQLCAC